MSVLVHPDRLFPAEEPVRSLARALYDGVRDLPIVSPHGHTDPRWYALNEPFPDPARLLIVPDHYIFRMLFSQGVPLEELGVARARRRRGRDRRRARSGGRFAEHYHLFRGTPTRLWLDWVLRSCSVSTSGCRPRPPTAHYDTIAELLAGDGFRPRALFERFSIEVIATTDGALDDLHYHRMIRDSGWGGRVVTAYRPDAVVDPGFRGLHRQSRPARRADRRGHRRLGRLPRRAPPAPRLLQGAGRDLDRPRPPDRRHRRPLARPRPRRCSTASAAARPTSPRKPTVPRPDADRDGAMSVDDGLVMQIHPGSFRNHTPAMLRPLRPRQGRRHPDPHRLRRTR